MYKTTIGLEIHVQQKTASKMFCSCSNAGESAPPNTTICPICIGHPGTMPVINRQAVEWGARMALALHCTINEHSKFDRKNYFYPDLPKGYQISQYDQPLGVNGYVDIESPAKEGGRPTARIRINRLHLEEDAAKLLHIDGGKETLVDYNRGGTPLMEIVTEPDFQAPEEAKGFLQELRLLARYLGVSEGDMEKGHLRCDANVSIQFEEKGAIISSPISEIKNLNSFRSVERALEYEARRMYAEWMDNGPITTRKGKITVGWDDAKGVTTMQRGKEDAHDYRYFPEPDLPPLYFTADSIEEIRSTIPELPVNRRLRLAQEYGVAKEEAHVLVEDQDMGDYFEQASSELTEWLKSTEGTTVDDLQKSFKLLAGWMINKFPVQLKENNYTFENCPVTPENLGEFIGVIQQGVIGSTAAQAVLAEMITSRMSPKFIIEKNNLGQISDTGALEAACDKVITNCPEQVATYKAGKLTVLMFLVGQVMKETGGKAKPELVKEILEKKLAA